MPTVIDSLVVQLGLDPTKFTEGQRQVLADFKKTQEGVRKTGVQIEGSAKRAQEAMSALRTEVLAFGAAVLGTTSVASFLLGLGKTAQQLGFVSAATGTSVEELSAWSNAAKLAGGSAQGMVSLIQGISKELNILNTEGDSPIVGWLRQFHVDAYDNGKLKESGKVIKEVLDYIDKNGISKGTSALAWGRLGADQDTINFLLQGKAAVDAYLEKARQIGGITKENAEIAREANEVWAGFSETMANLGNRLLVAMGRGAHEFALGWGKLQEGLASGKVRIPFVKSITSGVPTGGGPAVVSGSGLPRIPIPSSPRRDTPVGLAALISSIQSEFPGVRITSTTGGQHAGSAHGEGRAVDFTTTGNAAEVVAKLKRELGDSGTVIDATQHPDSKFWTGPHIHVQFKSAEAAALYRGGGDTNTSSSSSRVEIGAVNVYPQSGNPTAIAAGIGSALRNTDLVNQANSGQSK